MYKKCISNSYIYTKNVQTVQNLYKVQTEKRLETYRFLYIQTTYKLTKPMAATS